MKCYYGVLTSIGDAVSVEESFSSIPNARVLRTFPSLITTALKN